MFEQLMQMMGEMCDPTMCVNYGKPIAEGDVGIETGLPSMKICTPCETARIRLLNKVQEGITVTYRDGTEVKVGGWDTNE